MYNVRQYRAEDASSVQEIVTAATEELRLVYVPKKQCGTYAEETIEPLRFVAINDGGQLLGVAECIRKASIFYVQGVAVRSSARQQGVARVLLSYISSIAIREGISSIELKTIEETGNYKIFEQLGFVVSSRLRSDKFLGKQGQPVIEVMMSCNVS